MSSLSQQAKSELEKAINLELDSTNYFVSDWCLNLDTDKGYRKLSNFIVVPREFIKKDNGNEEEIFVKASGYTADGELPEAVLTLKDFKNMNWITGKWGFNAVMEVAHKTAEHMWHVVQLLGREFAESSVIYTHMGWKYIDDTWAYLYNNGAIGKNDVKVELDGNIIGYTFPEHLDNYCEPTKASYDLKKAAPYDVSIPLLALVYLCPLNEFFKQAGYEPSFITMLVGPTGTMKSSLAALVLNHFGEFTGKSLPGSFKDTANALEVKGFAIKDSLNVVDDYYPAAQRGDYARMTATMQSLIRSYGDRTARGRMTSDAKLRDSYVPRGNLLITGEDVPQLEESGLARLFLLEIEPEGVDKEILSDLQGKAHLLGQSMRGYIEWLLPQANKLKDTLGEKFVDYRQQAQKDNRHLRMAEIIAWLRIGYEMFIDYAIHNSTIQENKRQAVLDEAMENFTYLVDRQTESMKNDNPVSQFLLALDELLNTEKCFCVKMNERGVEPKAKTAGFIGYEDSKYYYLHPDTVMAAIVAFYNGQGIRFPVTKAMLLKQLAMEAKIVYSISADRIYHTKVKNIDGENQRFIWLKKTALDKLNVPDEEDKKL